MCVWCVFGLCLYTGRTVNYLFRGKIPVYLIVWISYFTDREDYGNDNDEDVDDDVYHEKNSGQH